ncbi:MAG: FAD-dependent monooxygenase [Candidatus Binatia bacterium]
MLESHAEVLVIGAGPTGLFFAGELARHGVRARIIDTSPSPHRQTRATGVQPAALEVLHRSGVVEAFLAEGVPVKGLRVLDRDRREVFVTTPAPMQTPYPYARSMPQWRTEEIFTQRLSAFGIDVERGVTAQEIVRSERGARVHCVDQAARGLVIHADYLVGAGGAHSPVRGALHENLEGITYPRRYLVADVRSAGVHSERNLLSVAIAATGMLMAVELPAERTLLVMDLPDGEIPTAAPGIDEVRRALAGHLANPFAISDLRWASMYHTHRRMVPRFSEGRCFLAGDAAHLCSPLGGEGMNSGILDGASLAWKLGAVLRRNGRRSLLDAYHPERDEIARQVLASSEAMHDFYYSLVAMAAAGAPLAPPPTGGDHKVTSGAMLDVTFPHSPIVGFHGAPSPDEAPRPGCRFPARTRLQGCLHHLVLYGSVPGSDRARLVGRWSGALEILDGASVCPTDLAGVSPAGAVLVRPDGYIGFQAQRWNDEARDALDRHLERQFAPAGGSAG